jgi:SAM-dependent methyltransferase
MLYDKLKDKFGGEVERHPSIAKGREDILIDFLERVKPKVVLEIGTALGISTALIAERAEKVYTIDIFAHPLRAEIWRYLGVRDKIRDFMLNGAEKKKLCKEIQFDFAFVDGDHSFPGVRLDLECVKNKCDKILVDDYKVCRCVEELVGSVEGFKKEYKRGFAYLERE